MAAFKKVAKGKLGYEPGEVDSFIARARDQYNNVSAQILDWRDITAQKFTLSKGGYDLQAVDLAIEKLQDTFAERELSRKSNPFAPSLSGSLLTELRVLLLGRTIRPKNRRFEKAGVTGVGYSRKQVDTLLTVVHEFLEGEEVLSLSEVREISFKVTRGGYIESQVDAYIERLVEYIQTKRFSEPIVAAPISTLVEPGPSGAEPAGPYSDYQ
jgi:DivIVA domain-containing protein